jgi:hypothetical protein
MKYSFLLILACLVLALPATAATIPQLRVVTPCSSDSFPDSPNSSVIWVTYVSGHGDTYIDGKGLMPMYAKSSGGYDGWQYFVSPGTHSVVISRQGYRNYTATVQVCAMKVTYVHYDQASLVITTAMTTVPTTTTAVSTTIVTTTTTAATTTTDSATSALTTTAVAGTTAPQDTLGSLSVTTTPAGAFIFIDGVQRAVSPATIPGLSAGTHTVLLKLDGYQDLSAPVMIAAGKTQDYATSLVKNAAAPATSVATANATAATTKGVAPGFEFVAALLATGAILVVRTRS